MRGSNDHTALSIPFEWERLMLDVIFIAVGCGCFVVGIAYAYACDRL
jgi:hypothetical protein